MARRKAHEGDIVRLNPDILRRWHPIRTRWPQPAIGMVVSYNSVYREYGISLKVPVRLPNGGTEYKALTYYFLPKEFEPIKIEPFKDQDYEEIFE